MSTWRTLTVKQSSGSTRTYTWLPTSVYHPPRFGKRRPSS